MRKILMPVVIVMLFNTSFSQKPGCSELYNFIIENGYKKATIPGYLMNSEWLANVTSYSYNYKLYVVAEIKESQYSSSTRSYIFCSVPNMNWTNFQYGGYGESASYGQRFHKYIMDYKCDCN